MLLLPFVLCLATTTTTTISATAAIQLSPPYATQYTREGSSNQILDSKKIIDLPSRQINGPHQETLSFFRSSQQFHGFDLGPLQGFLS